MTAPRRLGSAAIVSSVSDAARKRILYISRAFYGKMPARIALLHRLHVAAEGGRAAIANRPESFLLMRAEYTPPLGEEVLFVCAEDIGHFEPMFSHRRGVFRIRLSVPSSSSGLLVERTVLSAT